MNTLELEEFLYKYQSSDVTIIVCAIDKLPRKLKTGRAYGIITNLSKSSEIGSHWCTIFIDKDRKQGYFFDSLGFPGRSFYVTDFFKRNCKQSFYNTKQLQQISSKVCGMYAACFLVHMINGGTMHSFITKFSNNLLINDNFIIKNYNYHLRIN